MSYYATIHTNTGEQYKLLLSNGSFGGTNLLNILGGLDSDLKPFSNWPQDILEDIRVSGQVLANAYYGGNYSPGQCAWISNVIESPEEKEEWLKKWHMIKARWGNVDSLINGVLELLNLLSDNRLKPSEWFDPVYTLRELESLLTCLDLAKQRGAAKIVIQIA